jgi:hypothetical protein
MDYSIARPLACFRNQKIRPLPATSFRDTPLGLRAIPLRERGRAGERQRLR